MRIIGLSEKEQKVIKEILDEFPHYEFYYYGSRVKGDFSASSDLDILIKGALEIPILTLAKLKEKFDESSLPFVVNFIDYYSTDENFYKKIEKELVNYRQ